jgi:hypothetical protein
MRRRPLVLLAHEPILVVAVAIGGGFASVSASEVPSLFEGADLATVLSSDGASGVTICEERGSYRVSARVQVPERPVVVLVVLRAHKVYAPCAALVVVQAVAVRARGMCSRAQRRTDAAGTDPSRRLQRMSPGSCACCIRMTALSASETSW